MISRRAFVTAAASIFVVGAAGPLLSAEAVSSPEGKSMDKTERFGLHGKILAVAGERDALVQHLLEASRLVSPLPGCEIYIVSISPTEPDAIWVTEVWRSEADHDASLKLESTKALIARARPLIAGGGDRVRFVVGGKGLSAD
jgi:quinol monooxygenase YgiN